MTTPSSITVSLEWAQRLKEAGWPQEDKPAFVWDRNGGLKTENDWQLLFDEHSRGLHRLAAPTADEILRRLPEAVRISASLGEHELSVYPYDDGDERWWFIKYRNLFELQADTLANAAAAMFCYLADNSLLPK